MAINFIPNDPLTVAELAMRQVQPRQPRPANRAGLTFFDEAAEGLFAPGTPEFLFWQCREAALLAVEVWERLGGPLLRWSDEALDPTSLQVVQNNGRQLNAFYDRQSLVFFANQTSGKATFSGASTDVVAHEAGHAFLDAIRPELFGAALPEHAAFHEAFGDCIAIVVALEDGDTRRTLLQTSPDLGAPNFVEAVMEDLSDGIGRAFGAADPGAAPRRALNDFKFQLPTTLPTLGPPPVLTSEPHSLGRVFSGCFYDVIRNLFNAAAPRNEAALLDASRTAATLLIAGARQATLSPRLFQAVGRAMVLADDAANGGAHRAAIGRAFARHGVLLGAASALMPKVALAGTPPAMGATAAKSAALAPQTVKDIRQRIAAKPNARITTSAVRLGAQQFVHAVHRREVDLSGLDSRLKGVVALAPEAVVVGESGGVAAAFNTMPDPVATSDEVRAFVATLLEHDRIAVPGKSKLNKAAHAVTHLDAVAGAPERMTTHVVRTRGARKVLERVRFFCGPGCGTW